MFSLSPEKILLYHAKLKILPLAKSRPVSNTSSSSVVTYIQQGKNCCPAAVREDWMWEKQLRHQGQQRRSKREDSFMCWRRSSLAACRADNPAGYRGPHARADGCALREDAGCREEPMQEKFFWEDLWCPKQPSLLQSVPEGLYLVERSRTVAVSQEQKPTGMTHIGGVGEGLSPMRGISCWSKRRAWGRKSIRHKILWIDHNFSSPSFCTT